MTIPQPALVACGSGLIQFRPTRLKSAVGDADHSAAVLQRVPGRPIGICINCMLKGYMANPEYSVPSWSIMFSLQKERSGRETLKGSRLQQRQRYSFDRNEFVAPKLAKNPCHGFSRSCSH